MIRAELTSLVDKIVIYKFKDDNIEVISSYEEIYKSLYDTFSSFSNTRGGVIVFGIDERQDFKVVGVRSVQELQKNIVEQSLMMEPVIRPEFTSIDYEGKSILAVEISELDIYDKPCFYRGKGKIKGSYVRVGDADLPMSEYEVYSYEAFKRRIQDEKIEVEEAKREDLDDDKLSVFINKLKINKPHLAKFDKEKILKLQGIIGDNGLPTLCGLMLFGEYPQAYYPQLGITAIVIKGENYEDIGNRKERFIDNKRIEGTIEEMLEGAMAFVVRNTKSATVINKMGKREDVDEYPMVAIREVILNALIHRDYSIHTINSPIRLMIFNNRIEVENPGGLYGRITVDELGKKAGDTRNPYIAGALELLEDTENRFFGIPTIYNEMEMAGLDKPFFENDRGVFKVTLYNKKSEDEEFIDEKTIKNRERILAYCRQPRGRKEIAEYLGIGTQNYMMRKFINPLLKEGKLKETIPSSPKSKFQKYYSNN